MSRLKQEIITDSEIVIEPVYGPPEHDFELAHLGEYPYLWDCHPIFQFADLSIYDLDSCRCSPMALVNNEEMWPDKERSEFGNKARSTSQSRGLQQDAAVGRYS